ncbi:MAG: CGNR zinc finger domain-containing protein [Nocardioidaceae bacterium]
MTTVTVKAPGRLELVRQFVNTRDVEAGTDALATADELTAWLRSARLLGPDEAAESRDVARVVALREALRDALSANHDGGAIDPGAVQTMNKAVRDAKMSLTLTADAGWAHRATASGVPGAAGVLLEQVVDAMAAGSWQRLKVCVNDTCRWAFYDHSRARSGKWCSMQICGNRAKQQTWRQREGTVRRRAARDS